MWLLAFLVAYAVLLGTVAGWQLAAARWPAKAPVLAVVVWQLLIVALLVTVLLGGALLVVPEAELGDGFAAFGGLVHRATQTAVWTKSNP